MGVRARKGRIPRRAGAAAGVGVRPMRIVRVGGHRRVVRRIDFVAHLVCMRYGYSLFFSLFVPFHLDPTCTGSHSSTCCRPRRDSFFFACVYSWVDGGGCAIGNVARSSTRRCTAERNQ